MGRPTLPLLRCFYGHRAGGASSQLRVPSSQLPVPSCQAEFVVLSAPSAPPLLGGEPVGGNRTLDPGNCTGDWRLATGD